METVLSPPGAMAGSKAAELKARFDADGFVYLRAVLAPGQIARARAAADLLIEHARRNSRDLFTNYYLPHRPDQGVLYDLYQRHPVFADLARHPEVIRALAATYAPNLFLYENSLVFKPRNARNEVPWHQDFMNRTSEPFKVIAWMALDDVDEENGCMYVIPGSHARGFLPWFKVRGETHHTRLRLDGIDVSTAQPTCMQAGDVLLFHCALVHSSKNITSDRPRRAYRAAYQSFDATWTPRATPIVVNLGDPSALDVPAEYEPNVVKKLVHKLAARMARF
jgi:phytanoyl-CoA hydroxylase